MWNNVSKYILQSRFWNSYAHPYRRPLYILSTIFDINTLLFWTQNRKLFTSKHSPIDTHEYPLQKELLSKPPTPWNQKGKWLNKRKRENKSDNDDGHFVYSIRQPVCKKTREFCNTKCIVDIFSATIVDGLSTKNNEQWRHTEWSTEE